MLKKTTMFVLCFLIAFAAFSQKVGAETNKVKNILFINSYHVGYKWSDDILIGIRSVIPADDPAYNFRVEYMDTQNISDQNYSEKLLEIYRSKYRNAKFDLIISSDDAAYSLLLSHSEELFSDTPVIFCGVNYYTPEALLGHTNFTGVVEGYDIRSTIETAARLQPDTKKIYYINDTTVTGKAIGEEIQKTIDLLGNKFIFEELKCKNMQELEKKAAKLPKDSILLMLIYFRDPEGNNYTYSESVNSLAKVSSVPIYGVWDFHLGEGIIGGRLTSGFYQGKTAALIALKVLKGESPSKIPVITEETTRYAFDYRVMKKFGIKTYQLPAESEIINYGGSTKKQVLLLHSYDRGLRWEDDIDTGIKNALNYRIDDTELTYEYMDVKKNPYPVYYQQISQMLIEKYRNKHFDIVVAVDDDAFRFVKMNHDLLFNNTPVVFCGVNYFEENMIDDKTWFTGVVEDYDITGTIDAALKINPKLSKVVVINDSSLTGKANRLNVAISEKEYIGKLVFEYWENFNMGQIQEKAKQLPKDTIILLMSFNHDKSNNSFSYDDSIRLIAEVSSVPVYGVWNFYLGKGLIGGMITSGINQGKVAGQMIGSILDGEPVSSLPIVRNSPNQYMFDQNVLNRFNISTNDLPKKSIVINKPFSFLAFYAENRNIVLVTGLIILVLGALIVTLAILLKMRRDYELELSNKNIILQEMIQIDMMTGLINHKSVLERLEGEITKSRRYGNYLSILLIDIDNFKQVNDKFGHQVGDRVIIDLANILKANARETDITGRYGGEEFIFVMPNTDLQGAILFSKRLVEELQRLSVPDGKKITVSGGIAEYSGETMDEFIRRADTLLYEAKKKGKNQIISNLF